MTESSRLRVTGLLVSYLPGFAAELSRQGYAPFSVCMQLRLLTSLSRWPAAEQVEASEVTPAVLERFVAARPAVAGLDDGWRTKAGTISPEGLEDRRGRGQPRLRRGRRLPESSPTRKRRPAVSRRPSCAEKRSRSR
jgi:hypothetical protein